MTTAAALREAFDSGFAQAQVRDDRAYEDLLAIRLAGRPYAIRLAAVTGLHVERRIVPVPSDASMLLGLVGLRAEIVPVYDLGGVLGHAPAGDPRWLVVARAATGSVGLAFEKLESFVRVTREAMTSVDGSAMPHAGNLVRLGDGLRPLIDITSVVESIALGARTEGSRKES